MESGARFSRAAFFVRLPFMESPTVESPNAVFLQPHNRAASIVMRHWLLVVPGVLLLAAHLLPVPQNGALAGLPAICPFRTFLGWPCPGCGLTRSLVLCAHGDWSQAFVFHPLGAVFYVGLWGALALGVLPALRGRASSRRRFSQRGILFASGAYAAAMIIVWLIRLSGILPYPPHF
jgi:hypothetical protein